ACEELTNAERPLAMLRSEDHDVADAAGDQLHAPQDEGAHEDRAQLAVGLDEGQQLVATDFDDFAVRSRPDLGEPAAARQHGRLAGKHPGAERDDDLLGGRWADDVDPAREDDEEPRRLLTRLHQHLALLDVAPAPVRADPGDLRRRQHRVQPVRTWPGRWGRWRSSEC